MANADRLMTMFEANQRRRAIRSQGFVQAPADPLLAPAGDRPMVAGFAETPRVAVAHARPPSSSGDCARVSAGRDGELVCFLADVSGHGPDAAALARDLEARFSALPWRSSGVSLTALNQIVNATWQPDRFASAICFAFDTWTGRGTVAVAGQLPPIVKRGTEARPLQTVPGPALGLVPDHQYTETEFFLAPEDALVAVTDGITDPLATTSDLLGMRKAIHLLGLVPLEPHQICACLLTAAAQQGFPDDATILVAVHRPHEIAQVDRPSLALKRRRAGESRRTSRTTAV